jgi:outer membrane biosynthesis protein TonB
MDDGRQAHRFVRHRQPELEVMTTLLTAILYLWLALTILLVVMWFLREQDRRNKDQHQNELEDELLNGTAGAGSEPATPAATGNEPVEAEKTEPDPVEPKPASEPESEPEHQESESKSESVDDEPSDTERLMSSRCRGLRTRRSGRKSPASESRRRRSQR